MPGSTKISLFRIALLMERMVGFNHEVLQGIREFAGPRRRWACHFADPLPGNVDSALDWGAKGVLAFVLDPEVAYRLADTGIAAVDVANWTDSSLLPRVSVDDSAVGTVAADYLRSLGFQSYAMVGDPSTRYARQRLVGFAAGMQSHGFLVQAFQTRFARKPKVQSWNLSPFDQSLADWLIGLPKPVGIFAVNDETALAVSECCQTVGMSVPDEVAILGVDNDPYLCAVGYPSLSSVATPGRRIGYVAASLLHRLMSGIDSGGGPLLIPPIGVVARQSTNVLAIEDPDLAAAVQFIRESPPGSISVSDVVDRVPIGRRTLEKLFAQNLGRTPLDEIQQVKIAEAKRLLAESDMTLEAVARRSGFTSAPWLVASFRKLCGTTPAAYRRQYRV